MINKLIKNYSNRKRIMKIVKSLIFPMMILVCASCSSKALEGNWIVSALIVDGVEQEIFNSNINFFYENNQIIAKGDAGVNLYNVNVVIKGKSMETYDMINTGFMGTPDAMNYEDLFFESFINCDSYKIEDDILYIYNQNKKMELRLKKEPSDAFLEN